MSVLRCIWGSRIGIETEEIGRSCVAFYAILKSVCFILKAMSSQRRILVGEWNVRKTSLATMLRMELRAQMVNRFQLTCQL